VPLQILVNGFFAEKQVREPAENKNRPKTVRTILDRLKTENNF
jgi:hypothetical protein